MFRRAKEGDNLEGLARDSWQLELLVTGFALAGMLGGYEAFGVWTTRMLAALSADGLVAKALEAAVICLSVAYLLTLTNFFFHVVIRCLWIGALGSRSVMGKTSYHRRRLAPRFLRFLRGRNGDFDTYIQRLDDAASLIFAFTFLLIGATVSFFSVIMVSATLGRFTSTDVAPRWVVYLILAILIVYALGALLYLIDFLTAGYFKRFRRLSMVYYPLYRFFGWVTLARLYRPLYYNLLNRAGGRRLVYLLVPYLVVTFTALNFSIHANAFIADDYFNQDYNSTYVLDYHHYADRLGEDNRPGAVVIPSEVIRASPLRIRVPLTDRHANYTAHRCPDLPELHPSVLQSDLFYSTRAGYYDGREYQDTNKVLLTRQALTCLLIAFEVYVDEVRVPNETFLLSRAADILVPEAVGFVALDSLAAGVHQLRYRQYKPPNKRQPEDTVSLDITVPFYYGPGG